MRQEWITELDAATLMEDVRLWSTGRENSGALKDTDEMWKRNCCETIHITLLVLGCIHKPIHVMDSHQSNSSSSSTLYIFDPLKLPTTTKAIARAKMTAYHLGKMRDAKRVSRKAWK
ncbi:hypothetical protein HYC85_013396 [Camellia sinensis]|uniref:Uncharacterized protein n=1 Tax=Camellia sinensis TaxID=4442 RepID=A0A7J7H398_CAMSI|nr:hypothetical protein HYC85_013396 [Camellia sinensis]